MNLRFFKYFSACLQSVLFFQNLVAMATLLTVFSITEFSDPKHPMNTNSEGISDRTEVMT